MNALTAPERARRASYAKDLQKSLIADGIDCVVTTVIDNAGVTLFKTFPVSRLESVVTRGVGLSPVFDAFLIDDSSINVPSVGDAVGDLRLVPDPFALRKLPAQPGWAWAPADKYDVRTGEVITNCHRSFAKRQVDRAAAAGFELSMAFEIECFIGLDAEDAVPAFTGPAYSLTRFTQMSALARDLTRALDAQGISVDQVHSEYGQGQIEVVVRATDPVAAADSNVLARQTIRAVVASHGLRVSFSPQVASGSVGNGSHLHTSLWRDGRNLFSAGDDGSMDATAEAFTAGVLAELPALVAIGCPSMASYERLAPSKWAGAFACWGSENREAALRFVPSTPNGLSSPDGANIEVKCFDPASNVYLVVGAVLAAGLNGVERSLTLPPELDVDPGSLDDAELERRQVRRLPASLDAAIAHLESSEILREALGPGLFDAFVAVRRGEAELYRDHDSEDVIAAHRWRY